MKILFLDFDGVLNNAEHRSTYGNIGAGIDRTKLALVKKLIDATDAKIVLTTSLKTYWNKDPDKCDYYGQVINDEFSKFGLQIYDKTPVLENEKREDEIFQWFVDNSATKNYVAIDDGFLTSGFLMGHFVRTSDKEGLEEEHIEKAIEILNKI